MGLWSRVPMELTCLPFGIRNEPWVSGIHIVFDIAWLSRDKMSSECSMGPKPRSEGSFGPHILSAICYDGNMCSIWKLPPRWISFLQKNMAIPVLCQIWSMRVLQSPTRESWRRQPGVSEKITQVVSPTDPELEPSLKAVPSHTRAYLGRDP